MSDPLEIVLRLNFLIIWRKLNLRIICHSKIPQKVKQLMYGSGMSRETEPIRWLCLYTYKYMSICTCTPIQKLIIVNCLMCLQRLRSPKMFSWLAGDPGELVCISIPKASKLDTQAKTLFQSEFEGWKRKTNVLLQEVRREEPPVTQLPVLFRSSVGWMKPVHTREGNLLYLICFPQLTHKIITVCKKAFLQESPGSARISFYDQEPQLTQILSTKQKISI